MKKIIIVITLLIFVNLINKQSDSDYLDIAIKYSNQLRTINSTANVLFAKILSLEIGKQFSNNNYINKDLILLSSKLRQQIENVSNNFNIEFGI